MSGEFCCDGNELWIQLERLHWGVRDDLPAAYPCCRNVNGTGGMQMPTQVHWQKWK